MKPHEFGLILVDPVPELCDAFRRSFSEIPTVNVVEGKFQDLQDYDCMVSPGNSFGLMDGGVDLAIINYFGLDLMDRVQAHIIQEYRGEQPVGTAFVIATGHSKHAYLAHAPTMRVPMRIARTDNVYRAMQAMLLAVWNHNRLSKDQIGLVACPGLGTLTGGVRYDQAANQMAMAYNHFLDPPKSISWPYAINRQAAVRLGGDVT
jgi:O-acetyl-ADP-ribose deacetylase (regulator of RNase III)